MVDGTEVVISSAQANAITITSKRTPDKNLGMVNLISVVFKRYKVASLDATFDDLP